MLAFCTSHQLAFITELTTIHDILVLSIYRFAVSSMGSLVLFCLQVCGLCMMPDIAQFLIADTN
jgi:hypothetical protein